MTRVNAAAVALALAWLAGACGHSTAPPTAPTVATAATDAPVYSLVSGYVLDTADRKVAGVKVEIVDGPQAGTSFLSTSDGRFSLSGTFAGTVTLRATKDGYVTTNKTFSLPNCMACPATNTASVIFTVALPENGQLQTGPYTMTWITDSACTTIPEDMRTRTYTVTVTPDTNDPGYVVDFSNGLGFGVEVAGNYVQIQIDDGLLEDIPPDATVRLYGFAGISVSTSPVSTIAFPVTGNIDYIGPESGFTHATCQSTNHQLILTRR